MTRTHKFLGIALALLVAACTNNVVGIEEELRPNFDSGYTIGSGHRGTDDGEGMSGGGVDEAASPEEVTADGVSTTAETGYTVGSGH